MGVEVVVSEMSVVGESLKVPMVAGALPVVTVVAGTVAVVLQVVGTVVVLSRVLLVAGALLVMMIVGTLLVSGDLLLVLLVTGILSVVMMGAGAFLWSWTRPSLGKEGRGYDLGSLGSLLHDNFETYMSEKPFSQAFQIYTGYHYIIYTWGPNIQGVTQLPKKEIRPTLLWNWETAPCRHLTPYSRDI